ncbi:MAG: hypothetical protein M1493_13760 [Firmicutes bacterium]|jgi:hypothetical protein|nr:hypothetical protein [Bacillota bacterium]
MIKRIGRLALASMMAGSLIGGGAAFASSPGGLYQQWGQPAIYLYQNGSLHHIPSAGLFNAMGLSWSAVHHVASLPAPIGSPVDLIRPWGSSKVYFLPPQGNIAEWIPSAQAFADAGFSWAAVHRVAWIPTKNVSAGFIAQTLTGWAIPGTRLTMDVTMPAQYQWVGMPNPARPLGEQWTAVGHPHTSIVVSVVGSSMTSLEQGQWPPASVLLYAGPTGGSYFRLWIGSTEHHEYGTEIVDTGTTQYGWRNPLGHPGQDQSLLINVSLRNTPTNRHVIGAILKDWVMVADTTGATWSGNQPPGHQWLPGWPLNPVQNSNASSLPNWVTQAQWGGY